MAKLVVHCKKEHYDVLSTPKLLQDLPELKCKILGCWCAPNECHGDVLAELANIPSKL